MALNNNDRKDTVKNAQSSGYSWTSDGSKLTNGNGGTVKFSESGGSVTVNGVKYTSASDVKKGGRL